MEAVDSLTVSLSAAAISQNIILPIDNEMLIVRLIRSISTQGL